jgi:hypothetical protein
VPDIVKVGAQINVEDARLPLDYRLGHSLDRIILDPRVGDIRIGRSN